MENRGIPVAGERYRHFKGGLYQIAAVARHSETGEQMVVYQALYGDFGVYVRPLAMFMEEVDHVKYPDVRQSYRFERVDMPKDREGQESQPFGESIALAEEMQTTPEKMPDRGYLQKALEGEQQTSKVAETPEEKRHAILMEFLDADTSAQKLNILRGMRKHIDDKMVHDMAVSLDIGLNEKPLEEQIQDIENCLKTYARFECGRLR